MAEPRKTKQVSKTNEKTFGKQALINHFTGLDKSVAKIVLSDTPQTIKQAEDAINQWKKEEAK